METLIEYALKSAGVLLLFVAVYHLLLKRLTFFNANRWFLLAGLVASVVFPLVEITQTVYVEAPQEVYVPQQIVTPMAMILEQPPVLEPVEEPAFDLGLLAQYAYLAVVFFFLGKMAVELSSLVKLVRSGVHVKRGGFVYVTLSRKLTPFSFFNYICYSAHETDREQLDLIIDHEKVHAKQWHSVDLLVSHLYRAVFWWNPLAWIAKKQIGENLEFIADAVAKRQHSHGHTYERALLSRAASHMQPALANNFFTPFIKQRILMLQKEASATWNAYKYALILPVMLVFIYSFNRVQEIEYIEKESAAASSKLQPTVEELYNMFVGNAVVEQAIESEDLVFDITSSTTANELKEYTEKINNYGNYEVKFNDVKVTNDGELTSFLIATKFPSGTWNNHATVQVTDGSLWLLIATKEVLKLSDDKKQQTIIMSEKGTELIKEDLTYGNDDDTDPFVLLRKKMSSAPQYTIYADSISGQGTVLKISSGGNVYTTGPTVLGSFAEFSFDINKNTTNDQFLENQKEVRYYMPYDIKYEVPKRDSNGNLLSVVIETKFPSSKWTESLTLDLKDVSSYTLKFINQAIYAKANGTNKEFIIDENGSHAMTAADKGKALKYVSLRKDKDSVTFNAPSSQFAGGFAEAKPMYSILATMTKDAVREVVQNVNNNSNVQLELVTLRYKNGKISKIKLKATKNGSEQIVAKESNKGIDNICMQVTKEQVLFIKCTDAVYYSVARNVSYLENSSAAKQQEKEATNKNSGYLYYQNGTYFYVSENDETKIFNRWGVQVHEMKFMITSGSASNGKTTIKGKSYSFTIDKNGGLAFKDSSNKVVKENLLTADETFNKSQNIVLPAGVNKNFVNSENPKPMFVIDGKIQDKKTGLPRYIEADIMTVKVLKGNEATSKYGDAGKDGVVEITTKGLHKAMEKDLNASENATTVYLKEFKIIFESASNRLMMQSVKGTAWLDLSFSLTKNNEQAINEYGMTDLRSPSPSIESELANFLFTITKTDNGYVLKGIKGTAWTDLSFKIPDDGKVAVNQLGLTTLD